MDADVLGLGFCFEIYCFYFLLFVLQYQPEWELLILFYPIQFFIIFTILLLYPIIKVNNLFKFGRSVALLFFNTFVHDSALPDQHPKRSTFI